MLFSRDSVNAPTKGTVEDGPPFEAQKLEEGCPTFAVPVLTVVEDENEDEDPDITTVICCIVGCGAITIVPFVVCDLYFGLGGSPCVSSPAWLPVSTWFVVNGIMGIVIIVLAFISGMLGRSIRKLHTVFSTEKEVVEVLGYITMFLANIFTIIWTCLGCSIIWRNNTEIVAPTCGSIYAYANVTLCLKILACALIVYEQFHKK